MLKRILSVMLILVLSIFCATAAFADSALLLDEPDILAADAESELAAKLEEKGVLVRAGYHCAPLAHRYLGTEKTGGVRLSPGLFTTKKEAQKTLSLLHRMDQ